MSPRVGLIGTGGTIASVPGDSGQAQPSLAVAALADDLDVPVEVSPIIDLMSVLSHALTPERMWEIVTAARDVIAEDPGLVGVVVTHGTATLAETAFMADLVWEDARPLVLTGAMVPASRPDADGPRNLADAVRVAAAPEASGLGALVVLDSQIHAARSVRKAHTSLRSAFDSGRSGTLGFVDEGAVRVARRPVRPLPVRRPRGPAPNVSLIKAHTGMSDRFVRASVADGDVGVVIEAFPGRGGLPAVLLPAVRAAAAQGVAVVIASGAEGSLRATYGGDTALSAFLGAGAISADALSPERARVLLMLALGAGVGVADLPEVFAAAGGA